MDVRVDCFSTIADQHRTDSAGPEPVQRRRQRSYLVQHTQHRSKTSAGNACHLFDNHFHSVIGFTEFDEVS